MIMQKWHVVLACVFILAGPACAQNQGDPKQGPSQQQDAQSKKAEPPSPQPAVSSTTLQPQAAQQGAAKPEMYEPDCRQPKSQPDADLCVQRRVADAAEGALHLSQIQTYVGVLGLFFVLATLGVTAYTGKAASVAAQAAVDAVGAERAWMTLGGLDYPFYDNADTSDGPIGPGVALSFRWTNTGRSPSIENTVFVGKQVLFPGEKIEKFIPEFDTSETAQSLPLGAGGYLSSNNILLHDEDFAAVKSGKKRFIVYSRIQYRSTFLKVLYYSEVCGEVTMRGVMKDMNTGHTGPIVHLAPLASQSGIGEVG